VERPNPRRQQRSITAASGTVDRATGPKEGGRERASMWAGRRVRTRLAHKLLSCIAWRLSGERCVTR
jgi:hypothetical protein